MIQMMLRPRWVLALLLALGIAAAFALLGQWQLERAIASGEVVERSTETVLALEDVAEPGGATEQVATGQMVRVSGRYLAGDEQIIAGRLNAGESGYWVVSHFVTDAGASIPVARGWAKDESVARAAAQKLAEHSAATDAAANGEDGQVTLTARFLPSEAPALPAEGSDPHSMTTVSVAALINLWQDFNGQKFDGNDVFAGYLVDQSAAPGLDKIDSPVPENEVSLNWLNVFYALEWAVFAGFAIFLWYRLVKDAVEREQEEAANAAAEAATTAGTTAGASPSAT